MVISSQGKYMLQVSVVFLSSPLWVVDPRYGAGGRGRYKGRVSTTCIVRKWCWQVGGTPVFHGCHERAGGGRTGGSIRSTPQPQFNH